MAWCVGLFDNCFPSTSLQLPGAKNKMSKFFMNYAELNPLFRRFRITFNWNYLVHSKIQLFRFQTSLTSHETKSSKENLHTGILEQGVCVELQKYCCISCPHKLTAFFLFALIVQFLFQPIVANFLPIILDWRLISATQHCRSHHPGGSTVSVKSSSKRTRSTS